MDAFLGSDHLTAYPVFRENQFLFCGLRYNPRDKFALNTRCEVDAKKVRCCYLPSFLRCNVGSYRFGAIAVREEGFADPRAKRSGKSGLLGDGAFFVRGGGGEDSADRDGAIADGGKSAAADG